MAGAQQDDNNQVVDENYCPFDPDMKNVKEMAIISNSPKVKELEFNHASIQEHIDKLRWTPNFSNNYFKMSKYFANYEIYINDLYQVDSSFRFLKGCSQSMYIYPYQ